MKKDTRYKANRSKMYNWLKDPTHGKKGKAFLDAFDKMYGLKPL